MGDKPAFLKPKTTSSFKEIQEKESELSKYKPKCVGKTEIRAWSPLVNHAKGVKSARVNV